VKDLLRDGSSVTDGTASLTEVDGRRVLRAWRAGEYTLEGTRGVAAKQAVSSLPDPMELKDAWTVHFPHGSGAPENVEFPKLISWTQHSDSEIQHFSGTATYTTTFNVAADHVGEGKIATLELGDVRVMAEVKLNGKELGLFWKPPYRVEVSDVLRAGANELEVRVTNLWVNRLIGDEAYPPLVKNVKTPRGEGAIAEIPGWLSRNEPKPPTQRKTFSTWRHYKVDDPLVPSGLIGPVRIMFGVQRSI